MDPNTKLLLAMAAPPARWEDEEKAIYDVEYLRELCSDGPQPMLQLRIPHELFRLFDRRRFTFDVRENICNLRHVVSHVGFEFRNLIVRILKAHTLVEFNVLLDVIAPLKILDADVVNIQVPARGHRPYAVKDIFSVLRTRKRLHRDIRVRQNPADRFGDCCSQLL